MYGGKRVVVCIPAGRQRYLEILIRYIARERPLVDACELWLNTVDEGDLAYCHHLAAHQPWIRAVPGDPGVPIDPVAPGYSIYTYFRRCIDPDTIYVRLDDDIIWMMPHALEHLVRFRLGHPDYFLVFGNVVNNAVCSHIHQRLGLLPLPPLTGHTDPPLLGYGCMDPLGWGNAEHAEAIHRLFLRSLDQQDWPRWRFPRWELSHYERFSINAFAFLGRDFAAFHGQVDRDEEQWLAEIKPRELRRPNCIDGRALMAHFAFYVQRPHLDATDILKQYRTVAWRDCPHVD